MELDFLHQFERRMKHVGAYALLFKNSMQKQTWKMYEIETVDEQTNIIFSVLLFIMEQSLKDEICTIDDIASFLDRINMIYYKRNLTFSQSLELADFIVNVVLCDEGRAMSFAGFDYDEGEFTTIPVSFIANKVIYVDSQVKRTSYYLTEDGYNLMLSTLEIESSMQLTIHEMIFKMQLEKASYDKAADEIKNVFNRLRIQLQSMEQAMRQIRQNALAYSVEQYEKVMKANMEIIDSTKEKFGEYRNYVNRLVKELEEHQISAEYLEEEQTDNLKYLRIIENYLARAMDEYQHIFSSHFDLKSLYDKELESLLQMSLIQRFSLRTELYQPLLKDAAKLENVSIFLRPLFCNDIEKSYQLSKTVEFQKVLPVVEEENQEIDIFDEEAFLREKEEQIKERLHKYDVSLATIMLLANRIAINGETTLKEMKHHISEEEREKIFPSMEIFREIMIELMRLREIDILQLKKEREEHFYEDAKEFRLQHSLLLVMEKEAVLKNIQYVKINRVNSDEMIVWNNILDEHQNLKDVVCSNVSFQFISKE